MNKMEKVFHRINEEFYANGEGYKSGQERYAMYYESIDSIEESGISLEEFEDMYEVSIDDVVFPAIGFDTVGAWGGCILLDMRYDSEELEHTVLEEAKKYFKIRA